MSYLTTCQPGWLAVFDDGDNTFSTEPVACWLYDGDDDGDSAVRPICSMGRHMCDATLAGNFLGVAAPGTKPESIVEAARAAQGKQSA